MEADKQLEEDVVQGQGDEVTLGESSFPQAEDSQENTADESTDTAEKMADETPDMSTGGLSDLAAWSHRFPNILIAGRCTHILPDGVAEGDEEAMAKLAEGDKVEERYRLINDVDGGYKSLPGVEFAWVSKTLGDQ